ncbi:conserved hypothetical protein-putative glucosesorbosone dehydrogenases [Alloactinosynnema sp. L-07]|uniref:PA14 domain-containing protein n=1 Tax=Alloactinosynnema sp. L-07 TaxID=1653480 RepID=UPI00065EF892|nr:PA14 domain-containing protein [Alloactinosynnema sp. L-07]CRK57830.1 conserved hypothetical protein-putative glucosesorbosone dehydrogenases [Alloactinosynnema sp. L-07]
MRATIAALAFTLVATPTEAFAIPPSPEAPPRSTAVDARGLPPLKGEPARQDPVAPADPKADFSSLAGQRRSHYDPRRSKLVSRSMFTEEYENPDGTRSVKQSTEPLNVKDASGVWRPIDVSLETDTKSKRANARLHPLSVAFAESADDSRLVSVEVDGKRASLGLERAATGKKAKLNGSRAIYTDVEPETDLEYEVTAGSVKETIKLKRRPAPGKSTWRFRLGTDGLTPVVTAQGTVELRDANGAVKIVMPAVEAWDSSGSADRPPAVTTGSYGLENTADGWILTASVDERWLRDPARTYPVSVDPTFTLWTPEWYSYKSDGTYYYNDGGLRIGSPMHNGTLWRGLFRMDLTSLAGKNVIGARFDVNNIRDATTVDRTWGANLWIGTAFNFNGVGAHLASTLVGQTGSFSDTRLTSHVHGFRGQSHVWFSISGYEDPNIWTYKRLGLTVYIDTGNAPPAATLVGPADQSVSTSLTPTLAVNPVTDADGDAVSYCFRVATGTDANSGVVVDSGCQSSPTWTVPIGVLQDGVQYTWQVRTSSGITQTPGPVWRVKIDQRIGARGPAPVDSVGPLAVNLANGNVTTSVAGPTFTTVGGTAGVSMTYNSQQQDNKGLQASYFVDLSQNGNINPSQQPVLIRTEPQVNVDWGVGSPFAPAMGVDWFVARWEGYFQAPVAGTYQFAGVHDDSLKIWVNNNSVYDQPCCAGVNYSVATGVALSAGQRVPIKVELAERTSAAYHRRRGAVADRACGLAAHDGRPRIAQGVDALG